jgi:anaerobic nitric oxide reductase flavorubredoxin
MIKIKDEIYWAGKKDWDLKRFHGHELSTHRGSTYNSYIIKDEKTVLVDTVWYPYKDEFLKNLEADVGIDNIDMVVINHMEPDHGGSLGALMELRPDIPVYCTAAGEKIIKAHFYKDWNFKTVKTGDSINIGKYNLVFVEMKMLHWPDSMMTYIDGSGVLLSNDAFGQHFSPMSLFNDEVSECEIFEEAIKYYANILSPFSKLVKRKIEEVKKLNLPIDMIAPSHGVIWRKNPMQIVEAYEKWSNEYQEDFVLLAYDTMYESTRKMAEEIASGLASEGIKAKLFNTSITDMSDLLTEAFKAKAVIIGSCTVNNSYLASVGVLLHEIKMHKTML